jgi:hypothetical protein
MMLRRKPKRLPADNPLLRHHYEQQKEAAELDLNQDYADWLQHHGIDPHTGKMTESGVAFFKVLIEERNVMNAKKRGSRRRPSSPA